MLSDYVSDIFHSHIDAAMRCIDANSDSIAAASEIMVACMLSEGKILCCGDGANGFRKCCGGGPCGIAWIGTCGGP